MSFSYYNKDNELIKVNLQVGTKWNDLNINNDRLNSIFAKVDDGDMEITNQNELNLLEKLFKKADGILNAVSKNNILENEELDEIEKQIEEGKIILSKRNDADDKVSKTLFQSLNFIREDGIEISFKDNYKGDIADDESMDYSNIPLPTDYGTLTIVDESGKPHELNYYLEDLARKDVLDCRRVRRIIGEYLANLPKETINNLIKNGITDISFQSKYNGYDKLYAKDQNGDIIHIPEGKYDNLAMIISSKFAIPKREYKDLSFIRDDGFKIDIEDSSNSTSIIKITTPQGKQATLDISSFKKDEYHQFQLPMLRNMLRDLPSDVISDLCDEITGIKFIDKSANMDAGYVKGTNQIVFSYNIDAMANTISFVHELGHAIDNQKDLMLSQSPEFTQKFNRLKELANKLGINDDNHALEMSEELFASIYAYLELTDDESDANHIKKLDEKILPFKNSENPEEKECYELLQSLKEDVKRMVEQTRKQPITQRADNTISDLVKSECKELITEFNKYHYFVDDYFDTQYAELDMIGFLSYDDEIFNQKMEYYRKIQTNELEDQLGNHPDLPENIQNLFGEMITKLQELRTRIKQN